MDERTVPPGLLRAHRAASDVWDRIVVHHGELRVVVSTKPLLAVVLGSGSSQPIPPDVEYALGILGPVRFSIDFLAIDEHHRSGMAQKEAIDGPPSVGEAEGGEPPCRISVLCPECGSVLDGGPHRPDCLTLGCE
jgi:hypothetical protein